MTMNQAIVLFDVRRGFNKSRHAGTVKDDLRVLEEAGFIKRGKALGVSFEWVLTQDGENLCKDTLADLDYALREAQE